MLLPGMFVTFLGSWEAAGNGGKWAGSIIRNTWA